MSPIPRRWKGECKPVVMNSSISFMRADFCLLICFNVLLVVANFFLGEARSNVEDAKQNGQVYIVYMGGARKDHAQLVSRLLMERENDSVVHRYGKSFSGFAARLSDAEAESIAQQPEVVSVFRERASKLHTTRSWDFLMSQKKSQFIRNEISRSQSSQSCSVGADTIVGVIDTGIYAPHPSFDDKQIIGPIPRRWKGECQRVVMNSSIPFKCNRKLIGARFYGDTAAAGEFSWHGTHTASIAAGNLVWGVSYKGLAWGMARGGSPCSRIAAYSVCGGVDCLDSSVLKAFDDAIADGVDVLSLSISFSRSDFLIDPIAIGAFHAVEKGITVVCSAGNSGPSLGTVENFAPWILTVGATTLDRVLEVAIVLGDGNIVKGTGIYIGGLKKKPIYHLTGGRRAGSSNQTHHVVDDDAINCVPGSLDGAKVKGKIVICDSKEKHHVRAGIKVAALKEQGVIGVIYISMDLNEETNDYSAYFDMPFAAVTDEDGAKIQSYINSTSKPLATFLPSVTILNHKPAPVVPFWSSKGPPAYGTKNLIIKPDVAAPGVNILAAVPPPDGYPKQLFEFSSGTSHSCPHVSGLAALIKSVHPTWSPSAIRSAIMTTANPTNNQHSPIRTDNGSVATPYDMGAGEINPIPSIFWPGLVYETSTADYVQLLWNMGYNASAISKITSAPEYNFSCPGKSSNPDLISDMNYPSIAVSGLRANVSRTVERRVTNVGEAYSTYTVTVVAPSNVQVQVVPKVLRFTKNVKTLTFQVSFKPTTTSRDDIFGSINWSNGNYINVRSPFVVSSKG